MGLLQKWGGEISKTWKKGVHYVNERWGHAADFIDRKTPEFRLDVKADIELNKDNFNVNMDSNDIARAGEDIGAGIGQIGDGLGRVADSFESFGQNLSEGLEKLGSEIADSVQYGLDELGNDVVAASTQLTAGISSHGASIEHAAETLGGAATGVANVAAGSIRESMAGMVTAIDRFDATGGVGRHLMSVVSHAQAAGESLLSLDRYFARVAGEYVGDSYLLKVVNASLRPFPGFEFYADAVIEGIGGESFQRLVPDIRPTRGHYHLTIGGQEVLRQIPISATPSTVELILETLVGEGNVKCYGLSLQKGVMELVFSDDVDDDTVTIEVHDSDGEIAVEKVQKEASRRLSVLVSGDPEIDSLGSIGRQKNINLGPVRREFGVPFISEVSFRLLPSPKSTMARNLSLIARNKTFHQGQEEDASPAIPADLRRNAAKELAQLGPFGLSEVASLETAANVDGLDRLTRKILLATASSINAYAVSASATILLAGGETLEPIAMLKASDENSLLKRKRVKREQGTFKTAVEPNALELSLASNERNLCICDSGNQPFGSAMGRRLKVAKSEATETVLKNHGMTMPLHEAVRQAKALGEELREFVPPDIFHSDGRQHSMYEIVREVLNPTIIKLRQHHSKFQSLKDEFDLAFGGYWSTGYHDPVLTHLVGVEVLDHRVDSVECSIEMRIVGRRSGEVYSETLVVQVSCLNGEALVPIPLRFCEVEPYDVTVSASFGNADIPFLLSHFCGMGNDFTLFDQVQTGTVKFAVKRLVSFD